MRARHHAEPRDQNRGRVMRSARPPKLRPHQDRQASTAHTQRCSLGSAVSPVLANLFLHYVFDAWMAREFPGIMFERYVDDAGGALCE